MRFFDRSLDFRVRLFNVLAIAGTGISIATLLLNLITAMWTSATVSAVLTITFCRTFDIYIQNRKVPDRIYRYNYGYFMFFFPMLFFTSGGYKSGMPSMFIFAVLFTMLMLDGKTALLVSFAEF